mgnify:CR=1 FL=1
MIYSKEGIRKVSFFFFQGGGNIIRWWVNTIFQAGKRSKYGSLENTT